MTTFKEMLLLNNNELKQLIQRYSHQDLMILWQQIQANRVEGWQSGKALEYLIVRAFELEGAEVQYPYSVRMGQSEVEQIDGVIYTQGLAFIIECKDRQEAADIEPIAKLCNQLLRRPGVIFSRKGFTDPAVKLASYLSPQTILLWSGEEINHALPRNLMVEALIRK